MKQILLAYAFISLIIITGLSVLSYGYGAGYVYLYWREWQIQTNIWIMYVYYSGQFKPVDPIIVVAH